MKLAFVIPVDENKVMNRDDAEYVQNLLDYTGVKAKVKAVPVWEELEVYTDDEKKARKVIERDGKYKIDNLELEEARFEKGTDIGKPGKGFAKIAKAASKEYGSKEAGQKVAGAVLKKVMAKK